MKRHFTKAGQRAKRERRQDQQRYAAGCSRIASYTRNMQLMLYTREPGQDATDSLAKLGWLLGLAAETELAAAGRTERLRALHLGLQVVHAICLAGYRWPQEMPVQCIDLQLATASEVLKSNPQLVLTLIPAANVLEQRILRHELAANDIVGPELFNDERAAA